MDVELAKQIILDSDLVALKSITKDEINNLRLEEGESVLTYSCRNNRTSVSHYLIHRGADVNHKNNLHDTAFLWATAHENLEIIKELIEYGADVHYRNDEGANAVNVACVHSNREVLNFLLLETTIDFNNKMTSGDIINFTDYLEQMATQEEIEFFMKYENRFNETIKRKLKTVRLEKVF